MSFEEIDSLTLDYDRNSFVIVKPDADGRQIIYEYDLERDAWLFEKMEEYGVEYEVYGQDEEYYE